MAKKFTVLLLLVSLILPLVSCQRTRQTTYYEFFDTVTTVASYAGDSARRFDENCAFIKEELESYHKLFDIYYDYVGVNNLKTVNDNAGVSPVEVDERLIAFLISAKEAYRITNGLMNVAMGSVLKLWHDCREDALLYGKEPTLPSPESLELAAAHCDLSSLIIDEKAGTVYISDPKMRLDVGAYAKGYATEMIATQLAERGVSSYVLNVGGNIRAIGEKKGGDGWVTGITNPDRSAAEPFIGKVVIKDTSLVTSGDYERYVTVGGVRYHHIIDPKTGYPAQYFSSVSVFTKDSGLADALSTALFCTTYEEGLAIIESIGGVEAIWVFKDHTVRHTEGVELFDVPTT